MTTKSKAFLLKIADADRPDTFNTVAGMRTTQFSIINEGDEGAVVSMMAEGIFLGGEAELAVRKNALAGTIDPYEMSFDDGTKLRGPFKIKQFAFRGNFNGEQNYAIELEGSGVVTA